MKRIAFAAVFVAFLSVSFAAPSQAQLDPINGPSWWVHPPGPTTRLQYHSFITDPNDGNPPDYTENGFIPSVADQWWISGVGVALGSSIPGGTYGDGRGVFFENGGKLEKLMGNQFRQDLFKEWFVQVAFWSFNALPLSLNVSAPGGHNVFYDSYTLTPYLPGGNNSFIATWTGTIKPQPEYELFTLNVPPDTWIDSVFIGTHCVPEPGSLLAVGAGLLGFGLRVRRTIR